MLRSLLPRMARGCCVMRVRFMATELKDFESHYDTLEISPECTKTEIREAWLRLSMLYHPDLNTGDDKATQKFVRVKEAYKLLINDEKRKTYNDQIGYYHTDPPPDYHRAWTLQGEKDRTAAQGYQAMWSEDRIRELMSAARLREVNWDSQPPAERYRILMEEAKKTEGAKATLEALNTPTWKEGRDRYLGMILIVLGINSFLVLVSRNERKYEYLQDDLQLMHNKDYVTEAGGVVTKHALVDNSRSITSCMLQNPARPDNFWIDPRWEDNYNRPAGKKFTGDGGLSEIAD